MNTDPIRSRIRDMLGAEWSETHVGQAQVEIVLTSLLNGKCVEVRRDEKSAPVTRIVRRKRLG